MLPAVTRRRSIVVILCQSEAVDACPLLDEAPPPAVHSPAHSGVLDVVCDQEEEDEGEQRCGQEL